MYTNDEAKNKRENFRLEIRRKQIDNIMAQNRKRYAAQWLEQTLEHQNLSLYQRSLVKNELLPDLPHLLPSLCQKIKDCSSIPALQFTTLLLSNIMQDDITLSDRQCIYGMYIDGIKMQRIRRMSPLVEATCYQSLVFCMDAFDQNVQIQIQQSIIGRVRQIIEGKDLCLERLRPNYNLQSLISSLTKTCLATLLYFYSPQADHNVVLVYKIERTITTLVQLIEWWGRQYEWEGQEEQCGRQLKKSNKLDHWGRIKKDVDSKNWILLLNIIFGNISQASVSMINHFHPSIISKLIRCFMKQISFHDEMLCEANKYACKTMANLLNDEPLLASELKQTDVGILLKDLKNVADPGYLCLLLTLMLKIVETPQDSNSSSDHVLSNNQRKEIMSSTIGILSRKEEHTEESLMEISLMVVIGIMHAQIVEGRHDDCHFFVASGGQKLIQKIEQKVKNMIILEAIEEIYKCINCKC